MYFIERFTSDVNLPVCSQSFDEKKLMFVYIFLNLCYFFLSDEFFSFNSSIFLSNLWNMTLGRDYIISINDGDQNVKRSKIRYRNLSF